MNEEIKIEDKLLKGLNDTQKSVVVSSPKESTRILAGAGSGKTKVLTRRFAYLSQIEKIDYEKILLITINEQSVNEMRTRILRLFDFEISKANIHTFYTLCGKILREDVQNLGFSKDFILMDNSDKKEIIRQIFRHKNLKEGAIKPEDIFNFISINKISNKSPSEVYSEAKTDLSKLKAEFYMSYEKYLKKNRSIDYDGLIINTYKLLSEFPDIRSKWNKYFSNILVDEFQDIGYLEYEILKYIGKDIPIIIVGDVNQTVDSFKKTNIKYILEFDNIFSNVKTIHLNKNYRSSALVIDAINNLIKKNNSSFSSTIKEMEAQNQEEKKIIYQHSFSPDAEARWVAHKINKLKRNKVQLKDIAVFYRSSFYTKSFEEEFEKAGINMQILDDNKFYEREEIKDCIAFLRLLWDGSSAALLRILNVPNRNVSLVFEKKLLDYSNKRQENLFDSLVNIFKDTKKEVTTKMKLQWNTKNKAILYQLVNLVNSVRKYRRALAKYPIWRTLNYFLKEIKYYDYIKNENEFDEYDKEKNIEELLNSIRIWEENNKANDLGNYLEKISFISSKYKNPLSKNSVSLISVIHTKGTQFKNVFIVGLSEYIWPNIKSMEFFDEKNAQNTLMDNERRLFYIALTRTVDNLFLSDSQGYLKSNLKYKKTPSRFLEEIGLDLNQYTSNENLQDGVNQEKELEVGIIVMHDIFGEGTVMDVDDQTVTVAFRQPHEAKILKKNHPSLKKVS